MKFYFCLKHGMAAKIALVDSGATENFLNHDTARRLGITPRLLSTPRIMNNVDGTANQAGVMVLAPV
jgi:predicted aspartyl protease